MIRVLQGVGLPAIAAVVLLFAAVAARYFLPAPPFITAPNLYFLVRHRFLFLGHVGGGIVAAVTGLLQFSSSIRRRWPAWHRLAGTVYVVVVLLSGTLAAVLGPYMFRAFAMPSVVRGLPPMLSIGGMGTAEMVPTFLGFEALALVWIALTATAYRRARQRRFAEHRAWMLRSYSLTFAFVTVRFVAGPMYLLTHVAPLALGLSIWSWTLNLMVAEWFVRAETRSTRVAAAGAGT